MAQRICPGCRQHTDRDSGFCTLCGFDFASDRDEAYNRLVMFWLRVSAVLSVAVCVVAIRAMGRRPDLGDYRHMLLLGVLPAAVLWGALKLVFTDTRRKLWATALIPSMLMVAAVFAWRAAQSDDSSLSWRRLLGISSFSPPPPWLVSLPATRAASTSPTS